MISEHATRRSAPQRDPTSPVRILTGATAGIGRALAERWQLRGEHAFLLGRRDRASFTASEVELFPEDHYIRADLARADGPDEALRILSERCSPEPCLGVPAGGPEAVDLLVLNAGVGFAGPLETQSAASLHELLRVNLLAPMRLTQLLLPALRRASGRVVYISSVASVLPTPEFAVYTATKAAAEGFFRNLRVEERGTVEVQVLRPGAAKTEMHAKSGANLEKIGWSSFPTAEGVARALDARIRGGPRWGTVGWGNRMLFALGRSCPALVDRLQQRKAR